MDSAKGEPATGMKKARFSLSLRARLLLASALVQTVMIALLISNGISVMSEKLTERTRVHVEEQKQLLSAALTAPLMQSDKARIQDVLERARRDQAMFYLVLFDRRGKVVATSGWDKKTPLPPRDSALAVRASEDVFHTEVEIRVGTDRYGTLAVGLPTRFLQ